MGATTASRTSAWARAMLVAGAGAAVVAVSAQLSFPLPGTELPQSAQTLAVLLVGATLGARRGTLAIVVYVLAGACGLPVFADGGRGLSTVLGPSAGDLAGFVLAAAFLGACADRGLLARSGWQALGAMLVAHVLILLCGGAVLALRIGPADAFSGGVEPFLLGAVVKSGLAALGVLALRGRTLSERPGSHVHHP